MKEVRNILFYDGDCALCNRSVQFMLDHEKNKDLSFSSLQSEFARKELGRYNYDFSQMSTFALIKDGRAYFKSDAALHLSSFLKTPYSWLTIFRIVPRFIRNGIYDWVARNRRRWFKKEYCCVPDATSRNRFIN